MAAIEAGETGGRQGLEGSLVQATEPALTLNLRGAPGGAYGPSGCEQIHTSEIAAWLRCGGWT